MESTKITIKNLHKDLLQVQHALEQLKEAVLEKTATEDDKEFIEGTRQAWKEIDEGRGITRSKEDFLEEIKSW